MRLALLLAVLACAAPAGPPDQGLRELVDSGTLSELRWANFRPIQAEVARFYESNGYQLAWVRSGAPTEQAQAIVKALQNAARKGLDPQDYDAWRFNVSDIGPERFDLALTISAMRYIHDVSSGKVNPEVFSFGLHFDQKTCDLVACRTLTHEYARCRCRAESAGAAL